MAITTINDDFVAKAIKRELEHLVNSAVEEQAAAFRKAVEDRVRREVPKIVMAVFSQFDVMRQGDHLLISVKHDIPQR